MKEIFWLRPHETADIYDSKHRFLVKKNGIKLPLTKKWLSKQLHCLFFSILKSKKHFHRRCTRLFIEADAAIDNGASIIILSDRGVTNKKAADSSIACYKRAAPAFNSNRTPHKGKHCTGYSRTARSSSILLFDRLWRRCHLSLFRDCIDPCDDCDGTITELSAREGRIKIILMQQRSGVIKVMAKMGISTVQSYRGAQIFEAVGVESRCRSKPILPGQRRALAGLH